MNEDSDEVVKFMTIYQELCRVIDGGLDGINVGGIKSIRLQELYLELAWAAFPFEVSEKRQRLSHSAPVNPRFAKAWRDYEAKHQQEAAKYWLIGLGLNSEENDSSSRPRLDERWNYADEEALSQTKSVNAVFEFVRDEIGQDWSELASEHVGELEDGLDAWNTMVESTGFDLRGVFRRRRLLPFVLVPRHVSQHYGEEEHGSLLKRLQEAHDAFVFGSNFAAIALMRSILETTLIKHYRSFGNDLNQQIENCTGLPLRCSKLALHDVRKLANAVLHSSNSSNQVPNELKMLSLLTVLQTLIEGAPSPRQTH
jgi:hypothetical protein